MDASLALVYLLGWYADLRDYVLDCVDFKADTRAGCGVGFGEGLIFPSLLDEIHIYEIRYEQISETV